MPDTYQVGQRLTWNRSFDELSAKITWRPVTRAVLDEIDRWAKELGETVKIARILPGSGYEHDFILASDSSQRRFCCHFFHLASGFFLDEIE